MSTSVFELFKIGIGPSSSHTMGPWKACQDFAQTLIEAGNIDKLEKVQVVLYGSLAKTGRGHGTAKAIQMGFLNKDPEHIDPNDIPDLLRQIRQTKQLDIAGRREVAFNPEEDIIYRRDEALPYHANALTIHGFLEGGQDIEETYYSIGGGFIEKEGDQESDDGQKVKVPFPSETGEDLLAYCNAEGTSISEIVRQNELARHDVEFVSNRLDEIWLAMKQCVYAGCHAEPGELPGGLRVQRRAGRLNQKLLDKAGLDESKNGGNSPEAWIELIRSAKNEFPDIIKWISCFALATNEENATFGRVVTAPTNGAAGVIPAVLHYFVCFCDGAESDVRDFLLTAGQIGLLFKQRATISAAMGGCQAEIGVSSSMASAGLTECLGGSSEQALMAAEIAMEHHLGMTCDPIGGLVQVPCIERNTMGAVKAITASKLALESDPRLARVSLDTVIDTMWETAQDMHSKYKETSEGGLAANIPVNITEC